MTGDVMPLVRATDALLEMVAREPESCSEITLAAWLEETLSGMEGPPDRLAAREMRRVARLAARLAKYWSAAERRDRLPDDWRVAVDEALGSRGWQPALALVRLGLDRAPSPELFDEARRRWRQVNFEPWPGGDDYETWIEERRREG
jgi:hypothetical protein